MKVTLHITFSYYNKRADVTWAYHVLHWLRSYALQMVGVEPDLAMDKEDSPQAREHFPNLCYHYDGEGYYVGTLPSDHGESWPTEAQIAVGSVEGLYKELQKISAHMIQHDYSGDAERPLADLLRLFEEVEYDSENPEAAFIRFS